MFWHQVAILRECIKNKEL